MTPRRVSPSVRDNCKECVSECEHAGKDRDFTCINGISCKVTEKVTPTMICPICGNVIEVKV